MIHRGCRRSLAPRHWIPDDGEWGAFDRHLQNRRGLATRRVGIIGGMETGGYKHVLISGLASRDEDAQHRLASYVTLKDKVCS